MTDEEMAEEYADRTRIVDENTKAGTDCISLVQDYEGNVIDIHQRIKTAFLAGLKAKEKENAELEAQIEKMKCCGNCGKWESCEKDEMFSQDVCDDWELRG